MRRAASGTIERVLYAFLEKAGADAKRGQPPILPAWLAPPQLRVVPVSADQIDYARGLLGRFPEVRIDIDDTNDTLAKKIRRAEKEWVPYIVVVGKKEIESGVLNVRVLAPKTAYEMPIDELDRRIRAEIAGRPSRALAEPRDVSARPIFHG